MSRVVSIVETFRSIPVSQLLPVTLVMFHLIKLEYETPMGRVLLKPGSLPEGLSPCGDWLTMTIGLPSENAMVLRFVGTFVMVCTSAPLNGLYRFQVPAVPGASQRDTE